MPRPTRLAGMLLALLVTVMTSLAPGARAAEWAEAPPVHGELEAPELPEGWETVRGLYVDVHGRMDDRATLHRLSRHAADAVPELSEALDVPIGGTIDVYVTPSEAIFRELQPGRPPAWADGTAWPLSGLVFLKTPSIRGGTQKPLEQVLSHEIVHVLLGRAFAPQRPPSWLQEGLAQVYAGEYTPETTRQLARGMLSGRLQSLRELSSGFPSDPADAHVAYAQSADLIAWMRVEYGEDAIPTLVATLAEGAHIEEAVHRATGAYLEDVDRAWRARLDNGGVPLWWSALASPDSIWFGTAVLAVAALLVARVRLRRRRRAVLERERRQEELVRAMLLEQARRDDRHGLLRHPVPGEW